MSPNIIICFDGTSNKFGDNNTNVVRLVECLDRENQQVYYDPGVGTLPEPHLHTQIGKRISLAMGLAFGTGLAANVEEAYRYLMDTWKPGARVYLFGFSRGAYSARVLAAMLHSLGLLSPGNHDLVRYAMRLFGSLRARSDQESFKKYDALCRGFRKTFGRQVDAENHFPIHFLGLWDTVSSVGWVYEPKTYPHTSTNPSVSVVRHAIAIDEPRAFFRQNRFSNLPGQDVLELWFPGCHSDIGGGLNAQCGSLWRIAFNWMLDEAENHGIIVDSKSPETTAHRTETSAASWNATVNVSLRGMWIPLEYVPKIRYRSDGSHQYAINNFRPRSIRQGQLIHSTALRRIRELDYRPPNLSDYFIQKVTALETVPPYLAYEPRET